MGAYDFYTSAAGATADEAFDTARAAALHERGHGGYTGTIAEKHSFTMIVTEPKSDSEAMTMARKLVNEGDPSIDDKYGPAGCIPLDTGEFLFFGWAAS